MSKKVFITGATGFIGCRLINAINDEIIVLSRKEHPKHKTIKCDLQTETICEGSLNGVDTVFHIAGLAHDLRNVSGREDAYYRVNVDSTIRLAELAVKSGVKKIIFVSSVKAGGVPNCGQCVDENFQRSPDNIYGHTKRKAELELLKIGREFGIHVSIIRPSLVYGPDVKGNLKLMFRGIKAGWFPPLPKTENQRSMVHVDDLVQAILLVAEDERASGEVFIVTDGRRYSSREIYNTMCGMLGKPIPKWSVPKILLDVVGLINPRIKYKVDKLLGSECYSSDKLVALGFKARKSLKDMNETDF